MNYSLGPEGLVPSAVVFREFPQIRKSGDATIPRLTLAERATTAGRALQEMESIMARLRFQPALRQDVPSALMHPTNRVMRYLSGDRTSSPTDLENGSDTTGSSASTLLRNWPLFAKGRDIRNHSTSHR